MLPKKQKGVIIMKKTCRLSNVFSVILCFVLIAAMALTFAACGTKDESGAASSVSETLSNVSDTGKSGATELGEGSTEFGFTVTEKDGKQTEFKIKTDEKTVGAALLKVGLIEGEDSEYGLYVKKVNGITADYGVDGTYWAFYINGTYASAGVDKTDIEAGAVYEFKVE